MSIQYAGKIIWLLILLCSFAESANAHHAYAADFDPNTNGSAKGTIIEIFYRNPHVQYYFEVKQEDGTSKTWGAIMQSIGAVTRVGMKKDTFSVGDEIDVYGRMGRNSRPIIWAQTITRSDGTVFSLGKTGPLK